MAVINVLTAIIITITIVKIVITALIRITTLYNSYKN